MTDRGHDLDDVVGEDLASLIPWESPVDALDTLVDSPLETLPPDGLGPPRLAAWPEGPAVALEVVGGPEDGLRLAPRPGDTIGRWAAVDGPTLPLFRGTPVTDAKTSRALLTWNGDGTVTLKGAGHRLRAGAVDRVGPGRVELRAGDLLAPGSRPRVRFRALGE